MSKRGSNVLIALAAAFLMVAAVLTLVTIWTAHGSTRDNLGDTAALTAGVAVVLGFGGACFRPFD